MLGNQPALLRRNATTLIPNAWLFFGADSQLQLQPFFSEAYNLELFFI